MAQQDQNDRPPMSELPPKPSPNMQGPGPYGGNPNSPPGYPPGYGNPRYGYPPAGNQGAGNQGYGNSNSNETSENNAVARISLIHGDVSTQRGDSGDWSAAQLNAPVMGGDRVSTGDKARAELQLDYANILRLSEHTQANITTLTRSQIQIQLGHGMANYSVLRNSDAAAEIDTPNVAIRTERRDASFRILVTADDHTEVLVRSGEVEITTPQGGTRVGANQFITIRGTGDQTQYRIGEAPARDDWDQWNTDRDRMIGNSASRKHTNDYYVGSQDLDNNGTWQDVPDYGQAWFPNEGPDWAPSALANGCANRTGDGRGFRMSRGAGLHITTGGGSSIAARGDGGRNRCMVTRIIALCGRQLMCRSSDLAADLASEWDSDGGRSAGFRSGRVTSSTRHPVAAASGLLGA